MQCYVIGVNRIGEGGGLHYAKSSAAFSPEGERLNEMQGKENRYVELDKYSRREYVKNFPTRTDRRPEVYTSQSIKK